NPLRAGRGEQRIAARPDHLPRAQPPQPWPPAGEAVPGEAAQPAAEPLAGSTAAAPAAVGQSAGGAAPVPRRPLVSPDYDVVQVFYGTDRLGAVGTASPWQAVLFCFWPTASCALVTVVLAFIATTRRNLSLALLAFGGVGVSAGLAYSDTSQALAAVRHA